MEVDVFSFRPLTFFKKNKLYTIDPIRKVPVLFTKEEWVRQYIVKELISTLSYPRTFISLEKRVTKNYKIRADILVFGKNFTPFILIECKSPEKSLDEKTFIQSMEYNSILNAKFVAITNGLSFFCWEKKKNSYEEISSLPCYLF